MVDGEPELSGRNGSVSVDRDNKGLTKERLKSILGGNYDPIMKILQDKTGALDNISPAFPK
jgi:hypothetical protein